MTVFRDKRNSWKYHQLAFVEFLELLSRVALYHVHHDGFALNDEEKVYHLLEILHEPACRHQIIDPEITVL
jgi:hypothetical protein